MVNKNSITHQRQVTSKTENFCKLSISILIPKQTNTTKSAFSSHFKILTLMQLKGYTCSMWDVVNTAEESASKTEILQSIRKKTSPKLAVVLSLVHFKAHLHTATSLSSCLSRSRWQTSRTLELLPNEQVIDQDRLFGTGKVLVNHFTVNLMSHGEGKDIHLASSATASNDLISHLITSCEV